MVRKLLFLLTLVLLCFTSRAQHISDFESLDATGQDALFYLPKTHAFQYLVQFDDSLSLLMGALGNFDYTLFVPFDDTSSKKGHLSLNYETKPGGVGVFDLNLSDKGIWKIENPSNVDFSHVNGTQSNCSGALTPWNTIITCEETVLPDDNEDGYNDMGWCIEINPITRKVVDQKGGLAGGDKLWALGNMGHENLVVHSNKRTAYEGADEPTGYLFKFVADVEKDLSSGKLFVYKGSKTTSGEWLLLKNNTPEEQNTVRTQAENLGATTFDGIEDVEISPIDGMVYFSVKGESVVYRFSDPDPINGLLVPKFEVFVGNTDYLIRDKLTAWGWGNDNLTFDDLGNLYVLQDGGENYIWLVEKGHIQTDPKVKIFAKTPAGCEPTGMTFTPDFKYMFLSIQHPDVTNINSFQKDNTGAMVSFYKDIALVISRKSILGFAANNYDMSFMYPNPISNVLDLKSEKALDWKVMSMEGKVLLKGKSKTIDFSNFPVGVLLLQIENHTYKIFKE
jgi:uncharacterized protein